MADWRSVSLTELRLPSFFFRRSSLPMAERSVDFLRWGGPLWAPLEALVFSELALTVEYRAVLDGFIRYGLATVELRAPEPVERPPSGLGPGSPAALDGGFVGVPGSSGTVCGTSTTSARPAAGNVCATGTGIGGGGSSGFGAKDGVTGGLGAGGRDCTGCGGRCSTRSCSMGVELAMPVPGFRMGNSSSSRGFGIGIGPDMRPRTD